MESYLPVFILIGLLVGSIVALRVFFTYWAPIDRRLNGNKLDVSVDIKIEELKKVTLNVHFRSGTVLTSVMMVGYCSTHHEAPYDFKQLLVLEGADGKRYYARISEIEYLEKA